MDSVVRYAVAFYYGKRLLYIGSFDQYELASSANDTMRRLFPELRSFVIQRFF